MHILSVEFASVASGFFFFGVFVVLFVFFQLFFGAGKRTGILHATDLPPVDSRGFLRALAHITASSTGRGGKITVLEGGAEFLKALLEAIKSAKKSINITAYIWEAGEMTDTVARALGEKAKSGVEVRLLLDGVGSSLSNTSRQLTELQKTGAQVRYFRGIRFGKLTRIHRRNHRRAMIIDGKIGFTGGVAFADYWLKNVKRKKVWRDLMFRLTGVLARSLQVAFSELWANAAGEVIAGKRFYPTLPKREDTKEGDRKYPKHNGESQPFIQLASSPSSDIHPLSKFWWFSAAAARKRIYLVTPYFVPNKSFHHILTERAKGGVDVRIILPSNRVMDRPFVNWAAHSYYWELLEAGVRIFEYTPAMIHTKILLVDDCWSIFGTANTDFRSFELNEENVFGVQDQTLTNKLLQVFDEDMKNCKEIFFERWKRRSIFPRLREKIILLFAEQF
ncbi:MAG TPA: phospholipase D-like domain-containing protein [Candidatus Paceibacterota bacterium]|nr:phospholipase D-like domain-containing protein [Candidatus Paceibacterota bacterium]